MTIKQDKPSHPDVPDNMFSEGEETEIHLWQVYIRAHNPVEISNTHDALEHTELIDELQYMDIVPESVTLNKVSFCHEGTYRGAYVKAAEMCDYLNEEADIPDSEWEFERGEIVLAKD